MGGAAVPYLRFKDSKSKGESFYDFEFKAIKVFHMKNFYKFVYWWLQEEGYRGCNPEDENDDHPETYYEEWRMPDGDMQRRIWWRLVFNPEFHGRDEARHRYIIDINFKNLFLKNVDTVINGRKVKAQEGEIELKVDAKLLYYMEDVFEHPILHYFKYFFKKRWTKPMKEGYRDDLRARMRKFQDALRDFFNMATYEDDEKNFHLERGL